MPRTVFLVFQIVDLNQNGDSLKMNPLLVFDLDGTLIDSAPDIVVAVNRTLISRGKNPLSDEVIVAHIGEGLKKLIGDMFQTDHLSEPELQRVETDFLAMYEEEMLKRTRIFPGVERFLESYQGPIGIITNKTIKPTKTIIEHLGLTKYPWVEVFGADSLAEKKPSPLPLKTMMALAKTNESSTIMIGDGLPDVVSALRAGVPSIAIGFGYTDIGLLKQHQPKAILKHYDELLDTVQRIHITSQD